MTKNRTILSVLLTASTMFGYAQDNDFSIRMLQHTEGAYITGDDMQFEFEVTNKGPKTYSAGDKVKVATLINGTPFALDLIGTGPTEIEITSALAVGQTFTNNPGKLSGSQTAAFLGVDEFEFCLVIYGDSASVADTAFPSDINPSDNKYCALYSNNPSSIDGEKEESSVRVYPNPVKNNATITVTNWYEKTLLLYNVMGEKVGEHSLIAENTLLDFSSFFDLIFYQVISKEGDQIASGRIVVE